jgi:hypothetical protein
MRFEINFFFRRFRIHKFYFLFNLIIETNQSPVDLAEPLHFKIIYEDKKGNVTASEYEIVRTKLAHYNPAMPNLNLAVSKARLNNDPIHSENSFVQFDLTEYWVENDNPYVRSGQSKNRHLGTVNIHLDKDVNQKTIEWNDNKYQAHLLLSRREA